jgi:hypothetical protein
VREFRSLLCGSGAPSRYKRGVTETAYRTPHEELHFTHERSASRPDAPGILELSELRTAQLQQPIHKLAVIA